MAAWLIQAFKLLATAAAAGVGFEAGQAALGLGDTSARELAAQGFDFIRDPVTGVFGPRGQRKRRRRRRALTASDRADIAFIVGLLGPTAGKNFAVTLAGRSR